MGYEHTGTKQKKPAKTIFSELPVVGRSGFRLQANERKTTNTKKEFFLVNE
jgi:hypothetical protein